ncbi:MAG: hypothetical protein QM763_02520 [Agriterribacter sp.]
MSFAKNIVVAHRGAWKKNNLPENSIASLQEAVRIGCTGKDHLYNLFLCYYTWRKTNCSTRFQCETEV